jgi:transposase InsO family protein
VLKPEIGRVFAENFEASGDLGLQGVIRGKPVRTTMQDKAAACPQDHVNRQFHAPAPNVLWLSDFIYVSTWRGYIYVAFVIDAHGSQHPQAIPIRWHPHRVSF